MPEARSPDCSALSAELAALRVRVRELEEAKADLEIVLETTMQHADVVQDELMIARETAEKAAQARADFLADMSHEIRTPMNAVIGMTGLLAETPLSEQQRDYLNTIRASGENLLTLINDILDLSKIEAGRLALERQPFALRQCVEESLDLVASSAAQRGLNLAYRMAADLPEMIEGDITRLRQILVNLLTNAVKFTHHGEVTVSVARAPEDPDSDGPALHVSVKDSGIGISQAALQRLFNSYIQADVSTARKYGGTGLGLKISKRLCEMMGGKIWVDSVEGVGTTFHFTILAPSHAGEAAPYAYLHSVSPALSGKRLLLYSATPTNRELVRAQAALWGMAVSEADNVLPLLQQAARGAQWDLGLVELAQPEGLSSALLAKIRQTHAQGRLPLALLTATCRPQYQQNFDACLSLPLKPVRLYQTLVRLCGGQAEEPAAQPQPPAAPAQAAALRILLAEDNTVNQKVALLMLQNLGYRADLAGNGLEVLQALDRQPYDLVLMDVQMPEMDGLTATRKILADYPTDRQPKIVAMTAGAMDSDRLECLAAGMHGYLSKPIRKEELARMLAEYSLSAAEGYAGG